MSQAAPTAALALALALLGSGCFPDDERGPPCVGGFEIGQTLQVRLGIPYDAKGDYWWDGTLQGFLIDAQTPSCAANDGWQADVVLTLVIAESMFSSGGTCAPWRVRSEAPRPARFATRRQQRHPGDPNQTIAASFEEGTLDGRTVLFNRGLFTPSEDFRGPLVSKERPPLVVTRHMFPQADWSAGCYDAWIASWEGIPP